jgi:hypothetical protein
MHIFGGIDRKGDAWNVAIYINDATHSPDDVGLIINVASTNDPKKNENAQILKDIFRQAKIETSFAFDNRLHGDAVMLLIGKHP